MDKELLKNILAEQNKISEQHFVQRSLLTKLREFEKTPFVIIVSGIRRCGKSTLLGEFRTKESYYVNFDDERFVNFSVDDFQLLYALLIEMFGEKESFIFDEIQNIYCWERFVRRLHNERKKVYVSGSNATMLSMELGTHLTGRHISLSLYPFSFKEFLEYKGINHDAQNFLTTAEQSIAKRFFNEYTEKGGFPEYLQTEKTEYLKAVYENILYRDIITRYKLQSEKAIKELVYYAASNVGKEISFNTVRKITGMTSTTTIREYFHYLENSYLAFLVPQYNSSLKKQIYSNKKIYFIDTAMIKLLGFRTSEDTGRILENIIFLALKRKNNEIYFHRETKECDFVIREKGRISEVIQVTFSFTAENQEREIEGLLEAMKAYNLSEGIILTDNERKEIEVENKKIIVKPVWQWLLENEE